MILKGTKCATTSNLYQLSHQRNILSILLYQRGFLQTTEENLRKILNSEPITTIEILRRQKLSRLSTTLCQFKGLFTVETILREPIVQTQESYQSLLRLNTFPVLSSKRYLLLGKHSLKTHSRDSDKNQCKDYNKEEILQKDSQERGQDLRNTSLMLQNVTMREYRPWKESDRRDKSTNKLIGMISC